MGYPAHYGRPAMVALLWLVIARKLQRGRQWARITVILLSLLSTTRGYLQAWIRQTLARPDRAQKRARLSIAQHQRILRALRNRDSEAAREAMAAHILSSSADLKVRQTG